MTHFSTDNTNGFTAEQLARANTSVDEYVERWKLDLDDPTDYNEYKTVCERTLMEIIG